MEEEEEVKFSATSEFNPLTVVQLESESTTPSLSGRKRIIIRSSVEREKRARHKTVDRFSPDPEPRFRPKQKLPLANNFKREKNLSTFKKKKGTQLRYEEQEDEEESEDLPSTSYNLDLEDGDGLFTSSAKPFGVDEGLRKKIEFHLKQEFDMTISSLRKENAELKMQMEGTNTQYVLMKERCLKARHSEQMAKNEILGVQKSLDNAREKIRQLEYELETEHNKNHQNEFNLTTLKKSEELMNGTLKNELVELRNASIEKDIKIRMLEQLLEAATDGNPPSSSSFPLLLNQEKSLELEEERNKSQRLENELEYVKKQLDTKLSRQMDEEALTPDMKRLIKNHEEDVSEFRRYIQVLLKKQSEEINRMRRLQEQNEDCWSKRLQYEVKKIEQRLTNTELKFDQKSRKVQYLLNKVRRQTAMVQKYKLTSVFIKKPFFQLSRHQQSSTLWKLIALFEKMGTYEEQLLIIGKLMKKMEDIANGREMEEEERGEKQIEEEEKESGDELDEDMEDEKPQPKLQNCEPDQEASCSIAPILKPERGNEEFEKDFEDEQDAILPLYNQKVTNEANSYNVLEVLYDEPPSIEELFYRSDVDVLKLGKAIYCFPRNDSWTQMHRIITIYASLISIPYTPDTIAAVQQKRSLDRLKKLLSPEEFEPIYKEWMDLRAIGTEFLETINGEILFKKWEKSQHQQKTQAPPPQITSYPLTSMYAQAVQSGPKKMYFIRKNPSASNEKGSPKTVYVKNSSYTSSLNQMPSTSRRQIDETITLDD